MSLDKLHLPGPVLQQLYKQHLIADNSKTVPAVEPEVQVAEEVPSTTAIKPEDSGTIRFLGKNGRRVTMLVHFPGEVFIPDQHLQFLTRMLEACKMNLGDVAIVNTASAATDIEQIKTQLQPKQVFLFGVDPASVLLPFSFPFFKEQDHGGYTYLYTPPLDELNQDSENGKLLKSKLWVCLKKLFGV